MRRKILARAIPSLLLACMLSVAVPSVADAISDTLIVYNPAGVAVQTLSAMESQEGNGNQLFFLGVPGLADPAQFGHATTLCEGTPCDATSPFTNFSDIVGVIQVTIGGHTFSFLGFTSDGENGIAPGTETAFGGLGNNFLVESNSPMNVTMYLDPTLRSAGWTATFQSDVEAAVPEPGTLILLGTGLIAIAGVARRSKAS